jgi:hypothetical protein
MAKCIWGKKIESFNLPAEGVEHTVNTQTLKMLKEEINIMKDFLKKKFPMKSFNPTYFTAVVIFFLNGINTSAQVIQWEYLVNMPEAVSNNAVASATVDDTTYIYSFAGSIPVETGWHSPQGIQI